MHSKKKGQFTVVAVMIIVLLGEVEGWKMFHRGRGRGGMLGSPMVAPNTTVPSAEWFLQQLDHFNPTVPRTWEQVDNRVVQDFWILSNSVSSSGETAEKVLNPTDVSVMFQHSYSEHMKCRHDTSVLCRTTLP
jgi:hypothetical protein